MALEWTKYYRGQFRLKPGAKWDLKGTITARAGIRVEALPEAKLGGSALVRAVGNVAISIDLSSTLAVTWPPVITVNCTIPSPKLEFYLEWDFFTLFAEKPGAQGPQSIWGWIKNQWSEFKAAAKEKLIEALGQNVMSGRKAISLDFGWSPREFELAKYTLPVG